jgi:hypothetical protein
MSEDERGAGDGAPILLGPAAGAGLRRVEVTQLAGPSAAASDDNGDDNDGNQRRTVPAVGHRLLTVVAHRAWATVGYGSDGVGHDSGPDPVAMRPPTGSPPSVGC